MKQIKKKDLKEVIRLSKKWWYCDDTGDDNAVYRELQLARLKVFGSPYTPLNDIVTGIHRLKGKIPLKTYYKVFETLGFELV